MEYSFGSWIKRRRKALDLSQKELANRVGCSVSAIFKIESDARRPSRQIAELLAEHLQVPEEQRPLFLKVARRERMVDRLEPLAVPLEPFGSPAQYAGAPPAPTTKGSNLPQALTSLVGRERELNLVVQQLREPHCRALTPTGLGGVGKSRLALEAASQLQEAFSGGVCFVPLAGVGEARFILPAVASVLDFPLSGPDDPGSQLLRHLRDKEILLVLDNFEHLLQGVELLVGILNGAPKAKLLVTSREPLNLQAEWAFEVQGLPVPAGEADSSLEASSAVQLFVQRARQARLDFELSPGERPAVLRICRLVEGLPLGIELAAVWVRTLSCEQIAEEIERNLDFLRATARDLPERHRSLRAVMEYSWNLLTPAEQEVFRKLSVFRGGFTREAAREVAGAGLEEIASLVNKSVLKRAGEERYDLHEFVRQYAAKRLESDPQELESTYERYSSYYAGLMDEWHRLVRSPRQMEILERMSAELDNLRKAWEWMVNRGEFANILKSLYALWHFHEIRGRYHEAESLYLHGLEGIQSMHGLGNEEEIERLALLGITLAMFGYFSTQLGRYKQASTSLKESLNLLRSRTNRAFLADALTFLAYLQYRQGEFQPAEGSALESLDLNRAADTPVGIAYCLVMLSYIYQAQGEYEQAYALSSESLAICRNLGDPHGIADSLITLSRAAEKMGQYDQACSWAQEGLEISQATNDRWGAGQTLRQLGMTHFKLGEVPQAVDLLHQSVSRFKEVGDRPLMAQALIDLGVVLSAWGLSTESKQMLLEAYRVAVDTHAPGIAWQALEELTDFEKEENPLRLQNARDSNH